MKKYELQILTEDDEMKKLKTWSRISNSDSLITLKMFVANGRYRIVDSKTKNVVWEHNIKEE